VVADINAEAAEIVLIIHWINGVHSEYACRGGGVGSAAADVIAAVRQLVLIANDDLIAGVLNRNGLVTGYGNRSTRERVTSLRSHSVPLFRCDPQNRGVSCDHRDRGTGSTKVRAGRSVR
jgi:hypothetical protein